MFRGVERFKTHKSENIRVNFVRAKQLSFYERYGNIFLLSKPDKQFTLDYINLPFKLLLSWLSLMRMDVGTLATSMVSVPRTSNNEMFM